MSENRKLASVQKISTIAPIEGADKIVVATMENLGWECVISKKDNFNVGDLVVYIEVDSICPEKLLKLSGLWDTLTNKGLLNGNAGNRVKTRKFRGAVSQGLILPLQILEKYD